MNELQGFEPTAGITFPPIAARRHRARWSSQTAPKSKRRAAPSTGTAAIQPALRLLKLRPGHAAICSATLERRPTLFLAGLDSVLGGCLTRSARLTVSGRVTWRWLIRDRQRFGHIHYFSKETALQLLSDLGYQIVDYFYTAVALDLSSVNPKNVVMRVPRRLLYSINMDMAVRLLGGYRLLILTK
jgi:hypothetical protein